MAYLIGVLIGGALVGALFGLIPFFIGRSRCRDNMGTLAMICCCVGGMISGGTLALLIAVGFTIAVLVSSRDTAPISRKKASANAGVVYYSNNNGGTAPASYGSIGVMCISGSLKGRVYGLGNGLTFGRTSSSSVRFAANESGVSSNHCKIYRQGDAIMLVDLGSSYGTYLEDGRQLQRNNPVPLGIGSRFYVGSRNNTFEIVQN
ncbi:MAG: FHA domain-containing protein [Oscillospiraceae bacterium]|nr:FHA domain-containing protein [Oscillospiraceae bacterium]